MLVVDLTGLCLSCEDFSCDLSTSWEMFSIDEFRDFASAFAQVSEEIRKNARPLRRRAFFVPWRTQNEKEF